MTNIYDFPPQGQCKDEASAWVAKLDKGLTDDECRELEAWVRKDRNNAIALLKMTRLWDRMDSMSRLRDLFPIPARQTSVRHWRLKVAALVAVSIAIGWMVLPNASDDLKVASQSTLALIQPHLFETAVGEQSTVSLSDGTQVVLNTNTLIKVQYSPQHRLILLERGEVQVRVAEDKSRPLSVVAGENIIQAVGTVFNIEISDDQLVEVVVIEGRVLVGVHRDEIDRDDDQTPAVLPLSSTSVGAGEEIILGSDELVVTEVSPMDIEVKLSWQSGNLVFRGESLEDAVAEISRYTSVKFVIIDDDLKKVRVVGLFKAGDVDGLLAALRENFDIAYKRSDEQVVLLGSR